MNFVLSESELYLKVVPMDWIIFFVILGHLKMFDIRHALYLIRSNEYTGISVNVVPSMMTIMDLKRQFGEKVNLISIQHCHCQAIINIDYFRLAAPLT